MTFVPVVLYDFVICGPVVVAVVPSPKSHWYSRIVDLVHGGRLVADRDVGDGVRNAVSTMKKGRL
jgi:hypothetical protein